jgi:glycosyltransferase involved in cell wall biosynthesis
MEQLLGSSEIFVLASEAENFPICLLEAMSAGLAIVTTSGTGCQDVVGDAAILVPPRDSRRLAKALSRLISDEAFRHELGQRARRRLAARFSWDAVAQHHIDLYQRIPAWQSMAQSRHARTQTLVPRAKARFIPPVDAPRGLSGKPIQPR